MAVSLGLASPSFFVIFVWPNGRQDGLHFVFGKSRSTSNICCLDVMCVCVCVLACYVFGNARPASESSSVVGNAASAGCHLLGEDSVSRYDNLVSSTKLTSDAWDFEPRANLAIFASLTQRAPVRDPKKTRRLENLNALTRACCKGLGACCLTKYQNWQTQLV